MMKPSISSIPPGMNRRRAARYNLINFVWYKTLPEGSLDDSTEGICKMCDISASGAGLTLTESLPAGIRVFLEVVADKFNLSMIGEIVHSRTEGEGLFRTGIRFVVIPPNDRLLLNKVFACDE